MEGKKETQEKIIEMTIGQIAFNLQGTTVNLSKTIKYLRMWLDTKLTFVNHITKTIEKIEKAPITFS